MPGMVDGWLDPENELVSNSPENTPTTKKDTMEQLKPAWDGSIKRRFLHFPTGIAMSRTHIVIRTL